MNISVDYHCHLLPGIDDGAKNVEESLDIINVLKENSFTSVVATPHYYYVEEPVDSFISRRNRAFDSVVASTDYNILMSAEIAYMGNISDVDGIEKLIIPETQYVLIELPLTRIHEDMCEDMYELKRRYGIKPLFAHIERYLGILSSEDYTKLASIDGAVFQFNLFSFSDFRSKKLFKNLFRDGAEFVIGTDAHCIGFRTDKISKGLSKLSKITGQYCHSVLSGEALK